MAVTSWPFENADTSETQYSYLFRELLDPGVSGEVGDSTLQVTPGTGLSVKVAPGRAFARGYMLHADAPETLPIATAHSTYARVDRVVCRFDPLANLGTLAVLTGNPGQSQPPALTQTDTLTYEISLARVNVPANATTLSASNVTDERRWLGGSVGIWSTATRPENRVKGRTFGLNTTTGTFEFWDGSGWTNVVSAVTWSNLPGRPTKSTVDGRTITVNDNAPTAAQGADGDIWLEF